MREPSLDPYAAKLERFELFSTNQCYYLVGCDKLNTSYRVLKMDRTLIERPKDTSGGGGGGPRSSSFASGSAHSSTGAGGGAGHLYQASSANASAHTATSALAAPDLHLSSSSDSQTAQADNSHTAKPTLRPLADFLTEDPVAYSQEEIKVMLDMIHDGNMLSQPQSQQQQHQQQSEMGGGGDRQPGGRAGGAANAPNQAKPGVAGGGGGGGGRGLKPLVKAYGVVGFVRFLDCYYLTLITKRAKVGSIGGNGIYTIKNTETIPLKPAEQPLHGNEDLADPSSVLLSMWNRGKRSVGLGLTNREIAELRYQGLYQVVDLTKNFLFSYTYDLTRSLQDNFLAVSAQPFPPPPPQDMYAWNYFLTREFEGCLHSLTGYCWIVPIIHGAYVQRKISDYGRTLNVILLARRSRHFAGTRYLKRGVSEEGKVANDVEHEQILHDESKSMASGIYCSYLQVRGSLPVYWTQESSVTMPKPPIELNRVDPSYSATRLHFEDLLRRYSSPIVVLDLVKQSEKREREVRVGNEFRHAIDYVNSTIDPAHKIRYCALDYSHISKHRNLDVSASLNEVSTWAVNQTGFFCSSPRWKIAEGGVVEPFTEADGLGAERLSQRLGVPVFPMEQNGVLRTNCIDCLDRTNVAQFSAGVEAIGQQLVVMGIRSRTRLDPASNIVRVLIDMYVDIGDSIALQYGGSEAHKKVTASRAESSNITTGPIGKHKELLTSIRRYYSNAFTDRLKQDAMNLFLGFYVPYHHSIPLWEMETDYYLHNLHVKAGRGTPFSMKAYERSFGINLDDGEPLESESRRSRIAKHSPSRNRRAPKVNRDDESYRVSRVRNRCKAQNDALSTWWKAALQENITQRMWMQLGNGHPESTMPPRFERLYQPEKLGQFDRFFTRSWTTPVRRSHSSQHADETDFETDLNMTRVFSEGTAAMNKQRNAGESDTEGAQITLKEFVHRHGFDSHRSESLQTYLIHHESSGPRVHTGTVEFLGDFGRGTSDVRDEYMHYVGSSDYQSYNPQTVEEFNSYLHDYTLHSDNVDGILTLSENAHISETIKFGQYRGLQKDRSAIEVATAIQEQFNSFESLHAEGPDLVESELRRRGYETAGVKEAVAHAWRDHRNAQRQYTEIVEGDVGYGRSEMTTAASLRLYSKCSDSSTPLTIADRIFMTGTKPDDLIKRRSGGLDMGRKQADAFVKKASRLGIPVIPREELAKSAFKPMYTFSRRRILPPGFEQINEDMFARKDNKFMVFNGAGVDSWHGTQPLTKISNAEDMLLQTLS